MKLDLLSNILKERKKKGTSNKKIHDYMVKTLAEDSLSCSTIADFK